MLSKEEMIIHCANKARAAALAATRLSSGKEDPAVVEAAVYNCWLQIDELCNEIGVYTGIEVAVQSYVDAARKDAA